MRHGTAVLIALALFAGCAHKGKEAPSATGAPTATQATAQPATPPPPVDQGWPRTYTTSGTTSKSFEPQLEAWDGFTLKANAAVEVDPAGAEPVFGLAKMTARTTVDWGARTVKLDDAKVTSAKFPLCPHRQNERLTWRCCARWRASRSLHRAGPAGADLAYRAGRQAAAAVPIRNPAPTICFRAAGRARLRLRGAASSSGQRTQLSRVINAMLLTDAAGIYYLHLYDGYMQPRAVRALDSRGASPDGAQTAEDEAQDRAAPTCSKAPGSTTGDVHAPGRPIPDLRGYHTDRADRHPRPADYLPIEGQLLYVQNTDTNLFRDLANNSLYVLISDAGSPHRRSPFLQFVPGTSLPPDFKKIPDNSPKAVVKVSVPGTPQAQEAVIANSIPHTAWVSRTTATTIPIDGPPKIAPIAGTPLSYVANSEAPIVKVDEKTWYACQNGVWFVATSASGPWTAAATVPAVIYTIPPSSPIYYVTYVRVYGVSPQYVYVGYTPGYYGTVIGPGGVVMYGTGYYYYPWVGNVFYAPPVTYGVAAVPYYSAAVGFTIGFAFVAAIAPHPYYWGRHITPCPTGRQGCTVAGATTCIRAAGLPTRDLAAWACAAAALMSTSAPARRARSNTAVTTILLPAPHRPGTTVRLITPGLE